MTQLLLSLNQELISYSS